MSDLLNTMRPLCLFVVGLMLMAISPAHAQGGARRAERLGQLENAKIAFITTRLSLTQEQAQRFWPVYNEFVSRRRELNRNNRQLKREALSNSSDQQIRDNLAQTLATRQQQLNLEKEYLDKFQKVITIRQVGQLYLAERDFTKEVIKRVAGGDAQTPTD